jgi:hypothetical protein
MAKVKAAAAGYAAKNAYESPYVQRLIQDAELRNNLRGAYESARTAFGRLNNGKGPARTVIEDKKFAKQMEAAAAQLVEARERLRRGTPKRRKRRGFGLGRLLLLALVGGGVAVAASEDIRKKVLDTLFGAEEEFDYTSTTAPSEPAPMPMPSSSPGSSSPSS